jgi:hypothetical protein
MAETQRSTYEWTIGTFPQYAGLESRLVALAEECFELFLLEGLDEDRIIGILRAVGRKTALQYAENSHEEAPGEAADILLCLLTYAETKGFDLQQALDAKMTICRSRTPEYYAAKVQQKKALGLVLSSEEK